MCYSAQIRTEYKQFVRMFGAVLSVGAFSKLYFERQSDHVQARIAELQPTGGPEGVAQ